MSGQTLDRELIGLGVRQPWAELIISGRKTIEVRSQPTSVRGRIYIYSAKKLSDYPDAAEAIEKNDLHTDRLPFGMIVGTVEITACRPALPNDAAAALVRLETLERKFAWELASPRRLAEPVRPRFLPYGVWFYPFRPRRKHGS